MTSSSVSPNTALMAVRSAFDLLKGLLSVCLVATSLALMPRPSARAVSARRQFTDVAARSKFSYRSFKFVAN